MGRYRSREFFLAAMSLNLMNKAEAHRMLSVVTKGTLQCIVFSYLFRLDTVPSIKTCFLLEAVFQVYQQFIVY